MTDIRTVSDLIVALSKLPPDAEIYIKDADTDWLLIIDTIDTIESAETDLNAILISGSYP